MRLRALRGWFGRWERDDQGRRRRGSWSQGWTAQRYWPIDPLPEDIHFDDMALGLSRAARYRGMTSKFYSVAEHSVLLSQWIEEYTDFYGYKPDQVRLMARHALLHDASEAWIGDVARPLKRQRCMRGYRKVEALWERAVFARFNVVPTPWSQYYVTEGDNRILLDEVAVLFKDPQMWPRHGRYIGMEPLGWKARPLPIQGLAPERALDAFTQRFAELFPGVS